MRNFKVPVLKLIFLIGSIIILFYTFYKSEIVWKGELHYFYKQYYILSFLFLIISTLNFFLPKKIQIYLNIFIITFVSTLYLFEFYIDYVASYQKSRYETFKEFRKQKKDFTIAIAPKNYLLDKEINFFPLSGISKKNTILCNENGYMATYESDRYGFNNPDFQWDLDEIEFFITGDSFAHGMCVNRPNDISSQLRKKTALPTINVGYLGNGPLSSYASIVEYNNFIKIKNIVWIYYEGNDLRNLFLEELKNDYLIKYLKNKNYTQNLVLKQEKIDKYANDIIKLEYENRNIEEKKKVLRFIKLSSIRKLLRFQKEKVDVEEKYLINTEFKDVMIKTKEYSNKIKSNLYFVYLPSYARYVSEKNVENFHQKKEVINLINQLDINIIDIDKLVFNKDPLTFFPYEKNGHYTVEGYNKIAEAILLSLN